MTSAEFSSCKAAFLAALKSLVRWRSTSLQLTNGFTSWPSYPPRRYSTILPSVDYSDEVTSFDRLVLFLSSRKSLPSPTGSWLKGCSGRDSYNNLVNPDKLPNAKFPAEYDVFKNWVRSILEKREEKKAKPKKQTQASAKSKDATGPAAGDESDAESVIVTTGPEYHANDGASDKMAVDDDPAAKLRFKKKAKDTSNTSQVTSETPKESSSKLHKSGSSKRARTDSTDFNEEASLLLTLNRLVFSGC
ncbi:hypothetical protein B0H10DRAFT_1970980 [Mycena sp. CBHHK59/15]|nr:hypothetical protein B0H10DRAFT_1970980 [Mycena sp. CBHHK59/15]